VFVTTGFGSSANAELLSPGDPVLSLGDPCKWLSHLLVIHGNGFLSLLAAFESAKSGIH